jgi:hypothetical protein
VDYEEKEMKLSGAKEKEQPITAPFLFSLTPDC